MKIFALLPFAVPCFAWQAEVDSALLQDDQCVGSESDCVLNALQLKSRKDSEDELMEEDVFEDVEEGEEDEEELEWLKDISVKQKNHFKHILSPLQKPIVTEYKSLSVLDKYADYLMGKTSNATGQKILWNKKAGLLQSEEEELDASSMGRRRHGSQSLPPRARYVNKILIYLEKEMKAVWNLHTIVDRKRWGVGDVITSNPYGPHGEHPDNWEANGSFPLPLVTPPLSDNKTVAKMPKLHEHEYKSKYAEQLQEDYAALVQNILDANKKTDTLRTALKKMNGLADQFVSEESGVFNRIETQ
eukprot:CAMPEP_0197620412 /NCGR_PEP_ID=MMETSP1338-20131121/1241_1 /TAXON_ID=43686 ORGANISM="Pelagodinium beii, Strain RCC1491" /NCGR_SAMPLE_ID=MMETSP1338 /ASSEMBLY_ACC=CAM_ASM_000754 /LENGTH=301 /DNA_ID=CAMNT_0043189589 /DNA_START=72 /DNA_END=977 /DNA_ORIENTATION=-